MVDGAKSLHRQPTELAGPRGDHGWLLPLAVLDACVVYCAHFLHMQFTGVVEVPYRSRGCNGRDCHAPVKR